MPAGASSRTQLMVSIAAGEGAPERLAAVLAAVAAASIVVTAPAGRELVAGDVLPLIATGQKAGAAVLIEGDARLARAVRADGVHVPYSDTVGDSYAEARAIVGGRGIVGADAGRSRHDAMHLGEVGADYVAFGVPAFVKDRETAAERQLELVEWWADIFEIPCVALDVADPAQAGELAAAGADFVCLPIAAGIAPADA
ncbi:MAG: thiamine phosphate synthase, partial [Hyphomicrobiaceae bacterium]